MTREQAAKILPIIQQWVDGKELQTRESGGQWITRNSCAFYNDLDYRIKPTPTLRPWKPEEVPVGALIREKGMSSVVLIIGQSSGDVICYAYRTISRLTPKTCLDQEEHSLDHGKTWLPCGVYES